MSIQKKIAIIEVYYIIGIYNNNTCHLRIIIEPRTYVVEYVYLSDLNFYLNIADLYTYFSTNCIFPKTKKCSCYRLYPIYYLFSFYTLHHYIGRQLYPLVSPLFMII